MSLPGSGCCCGIIVGIFFSILLAVVGTIAVFCWFNPEARDNGISVIEKTWDKVKSAGDELIGTVPKVEVPKVEMPKISAPAIKLK